MIPTDQSVCQSKEMPDNDEVVMENERPSESRKLFAVEKVDPMFGRGKRDWSVDVLRCLACFMVCAIHATNVTYNKGVTCSGENEWLHLEVYRMIFASPTVLFVMVSGIFFLSPERNVRAPKVWKRNVIKMSFAYIFWSLIYALYRLYSADPAVELTWDRMFNEWLIEPVHLWYIPMIIGLYIICPILRPITATYDKKLFSYLIILFIGGLILCTIINWPTLPEEGSVTKVIIARTPMGLICQYPMWMIFGWIAYTYRPPRILRIVIYAVGIATILVGITIYVHLGIFPDDYTFIALTQKFSIFVFLKNTALFYFIVSVFRDHKFSELGKKILRKWSDCTLIIYLIHYLFLYWMSDNDFLYGAGVSPWIGVWVYALIAYFGGGIIAILFHLLWDPIRKSLFSRKKRSERIYEKLDRADNSKNHKQQDQK